METQTQTKTKVSVSDNVVSKSKKKVTSKKTKPVRTAVSKFDIELNPTKLRVARLSARMTQKDLAVALDISLPSYAVIERGEKDIRRSLASELCEILKVNLKDVFQETPHSPLKVFAI